MKTILFDFDGTLADSKGLAISLINQFAPKYKYHKVEDPNEIEKLNLMSLRERMKYVGISMFSLPFLLRDIQTAYKEKIKAILPIEGMDQLVQELAKAGYPLAIITSNREPIVKQFVQTHQMDVFSTIHGERDIFGKGKVIRQFLEDHQLTVNDAVYIGDELRDIEACHQVGIPIYAVTWGFDPEPLLQSGNPTRLIHSPQALWEAILSDKEEKP